MSDETTNRAGGAGTGAHGNAAALTDITAARREWEAGRLSRVKSRDGLYTSISGNPDLPCWVTRRCAQPTWPRLSSASSS